MRKFLIILFLSTSVALWSQQQKRNAPVTIRGVIGIPSAISSQKFRTCFAGVYEANLSVNARLFSNFFVGLGYQNSFFKNSGFLKYAYFNTSIPYNTRLIGNGIFLKIGYDKFFEKGYVSFSLNSGYMLVDYINVNKDTTTANQPYQPTKFNAPYIQPEIAVNFLADRSLTFSLLLSYTTLFYRFDARAPRFNHFLQVQEAKNNYFMGWLNIGFGLNVLINSK